MGAVQGETLGKDRRCNVQRQPGRQRSARERSWRQRTLVRVVEGARPGKAFDDHILNTPPKQAARTGVEYVSVVFAKMLKTR